MPYLLQTRGPVHVRRLQEGLVHAGQRRKIDDGAPARALPDPAEHVHPFEQPCLLHEEHGLHPQGVQQLVDHTGGGA